MKNICAINLNEGEGRQTIVWNPIDGKLYYMSCTGYCEVDGYQWGTFAEAVEAADIMWGRSDIAGVWALEWCEGDEPQIWYAVMKDREDEDWGTGSKSRSEAIEMAQDYFDEYQDCYIAVIDESNACPLCIGTIDDF